LLALQKVFLCLEENVTDLLEETDTLGSKPFDTFMDPIICFDQNLRKPLAGLEKYR